eukprot:TRINITY_DN12880_c0_g3_i1.p1 TRINITY_DN12880_c0_g3~~TRINITY_DN12880_c0_g3_i1.p1  ORF type:complete len:571 (+),score=101.98 TRINITY_DN12880_c0_g3_i1:31-1713(+)
MEEAPPKRIGCKVRRDASAAQTLVGASVAAPGAAASAPSQAPPPLRRKITLKSAAVGASTASSAAGAFAPSPAPPPLRRKVSSASVGATTAESSAARSASSGGGRGRANKVAGEEPAPAAAPTRSSRVASVRSPPVTPETVPTAPDVPSLARGKRGASAAFSGSSCSPAQATCNGVVHRIHRSASNGDVNSTTTSRKPPKAGASTSSASIDNQTVSHPFMSSAVGEDVSDSGAVSTSAAATSEVLEQERGGDEAARTHAADSAKSSSLSKPTSPRVAKRPRREEAHIALQTDTAVSETATTNACAPSASSSSSSSSSISTDPSPSIASLASVAGSTKDEVAARVVDLTPTTPVRTRDKAVCASPDSGESSKMPLCGGGAYASREASSRFLGDGSCVFCIEPLLGSATVLAVCGHIYHLRCLRMSASDTCPTCRGSIDKPRERLSASSSVSSRAPRDEGLPSPRPPRRTSLSRCNADAHHKPPGVYERLARVKRFVRCVPSSYTGLEEFTRPDLLVRINEMAARMSEGPFSLEELSLAVEEMAQSGREGVVLDDNRVMILA